MDYSTLIGSKTTAGSIKYLINYSEIDAAGIISNAENAMYARLRVRQMRKVTTIAVAEDDTQVSLPTDWLSPISLRLRFHHELVPRTADKLGDYRTYDESTNDVRVGLPTNVFFTQSYIEFDVKSDDDYTIDAVYYARPAALTEDNTTNFLTDDLSHIFQNKILELAYLDRKEFALSTHYRKLFDFEMREFEQMADLENDTIIYDYEQV